MATTIRLTLNALCIVLYAAAVYLLWVKEALGYWFLVGGGVADIVMYFVPLGKRPTLLDGISVLIAIAALVIGVLGLLQGVVT